MTVPEPDDAPARPPDTLRDLVAAQVRDAPERLAVEDGDGRRLTYRELWSEAGRVAGALAATGTGAAEAVAIAADRSIEMVVAMVGVLRLGGWYVLLDPLSPPERNQLLVNDAGARVLVEASSATSNQPDWSISGVPHRILLPLSGESTQAGGFDEPMPHPEQVRYVAYTSGSTGRPKGVIASDRAVVTFVTETDLCPLIPDDRVASLSNPASDATTLEIWKPLVAGATIVVLPQLSELDVPDWRALLRERGISVMFMMAGLVELICREDPGVFAPLDTLIFGGEPLNPATAVRISTTAPPRRLVLGYGPTEATVFCTYFECTAESVAARDRIPLGFPLRHYRLFVVDEQLRPVPDGEVGELCVGGPSVASGYLARPELTAGRFIHLHQAGNATREQAGASAGEIAYRTGDLVRRLPDGALEFVARVDRQVKVRGYRIELEEVERAVQATGMVRAAVVEKVAGEPPHLACFYVPAAGTEPLDPSEFAIKATAQLAERLPGYMLPARWLALPALPFTSFGKVDRARLLASLQPGDHASEGEETFPRT